MINESISLIRYSAVSDMTFTLVWPLVPWIIQVLVVGIFISIGVYLVSATEELWKIQETCYCGEKQLLENDR